MSWMAVAVSQITKCIILNCPQHFILTDKAQKFTVAEAKRIIPFGYGGFAPRWQPAPTGAFSGSAFCIDSVGHGQTADGL